MKMLARLFRAFFSMTWLRVIWRRILERRWFRFSRRQLFVLLALCLMPVLGVLLPRLYTASRARHQVYTVATVPDRRVAIVFGAQVHANGRLSAMLADRVAAGAALYHAGKVEVLLLTGDNSVVYYNEPVAMRRHALQLGVPAEAIVLDYAGFRTYDSCYRARDIFQVEQAILVTQAFHLDRALFICGQLGVNAVGVAADAQRPGGYSTGSMFFSQVRELPATVAAVLDILRRPKPVLGDPLPIFAEVR